MGESYRNIELTCPMCHIAKEIKIPDQIFSQKRFGIIKVQVPQGGVCSEHQFIAFVDTKGIIRGYEKIDFLMKTPTKVTKFSLHSFIKNFGSYGFFSLIHAKVFNYQTFIVSDTEIEMKLEVINKLGDSLLPEKYRGTNDIKFLKGTDYDEIKKEKNTLIMDSHQRILQTPWDKKLKFEEEIIKKALTITNEDDQRILIQEQIREFIREAEFSSEILEKAETYEDELIEKISRELMVPKGNSYRISLIKEFIERRISQKLTKKLKNKVEEFLGSL